MDATNWYKQTPDKPLFSNLLWSRPENKRHAGKLLIIGGNSHAFNEVSMAYASAETAGIGTARVILPDKLERTLSKVFPEAEFVSSTPSGSFAKTSLGPICDAASWADGVLLAGDFGKNSETAVLLESFAEKCSGQLTFTGDSLDYFYNSSAKVLDRPSATLVAEFGQLQKLFAGRLLLKHSMDLVQVVAALQKFSVDCPAAIVTAHADQIIVASGGWASTTPVKNFDSAKLAAYCSTWNLQHPGQEFKALTTAAFEYCA